MLRMVYIRGKVNFWLLVVVLPVLITILAVVLAGCLTQAIEATSFPDQVQYFKMDGMTCLRIDSRKAYNNFAVTCNWAEWDRTIDGTPEAITPKS